MMTGDDQLRKEKHSKELPSSLLFVVNCRVLYCRVLGLLP
jgi:hypothetical protein